MSAKTSKKAASKSKKTVEKIEGDEVPEPVIEVPGTDEKVHFISEQHFRTLLYTHITQIEENLADLKERLDALDQRLEQHFNW